MTPFEAVYGRKAILPFHLQHYKTPKINAKTAEKRDVYKCKIGIMQKKACETNRKTQNETKKRYDKNTKEKSFQPGDVIALREKKPSKKKVQNLLINLKERTRCRT